MAALTATLLLALASTATAKGARVRGGGKIDPDYIVPIATGVTIVVLACYLFPYFKLRKTAPMWWALNIVFIGQILNFFTGLATAVPDFGEKLPSLWGVADAFANFFFMGGNILVFVTVMKAMFNEKTMWLPLKVGFYVWQAGMWFAAGFSWGMIVRYSMAWREVHDFLIKNERNANTEALEAQYKHLLDNYRYWNDMMRDTIIGVDGAYLFIAIVIIVLCLIKKKALTTKERVVFPWVILLSRLVAQLITVALQASFLWKDGQWSAKGFTITTWVVLCVCWITTFAGYNSIIKSYRAIIDPSSVKSNKDRDEDEGESLTGGTAGPTAYPQGQRDVEGGDYGYAAMPASAADAPYPTYAPTDTRYSRTSYEAPEGHVEGKMDKKGKKQKKDKKVELVGKRTLDRIAEVIPVKH